MEGRKISATIIDKVEFQTNVNSSAARRSHYNIIALATRVEKNKVIEAYV